MSDNKQETIRLLRAQMKVLKKAGETELADQLNERIEALRAKPSEILMYFEDGRVHFRTPYPGRTRRYPFTLKLKEAGTDADGSHTHTYDPKTKEWSFRATPAIVANVQAAIGDFFSEAPLVNREGAPCGKLPASTYVAPAES
jgi:hypothetical protein